MSVLLETTLGDLVVDLYTQDCPTTCLNFLKLCKAKYYNGCLVFNVVADYLLQTGDPTGTGRGGSSLAGLLHGEAARFLPGELRKHLRHDRLGTLSMANFGDPDTNASQFLLTTREKCPALDDKNTVFGRVVEGLDVLAKINAVYCDAGGRPLADIRLLHTSVLIDPFDDPPGLARLLPPASPTYARPPAETVPPRLDLADIAAAEAEVASGGLAQLDSALSDKLAEQEARSRAVMLEMLGDLPDADAAPPENVLFVCKLNPATRDADLELIFSRFGGVRKCEVVRDKKSGASLGYAFIEFEAAAQCEAAYAKMNNVVIDDRRIKVDFSQSVAGLWRQYRGGGRRAGAGGGGSSSGQPQRPPVAAPVHASSVHAAAGEIVQRVRPSRFGPAVATAAPTAEAPVAQPPPTAVAPPPPPSHAEARSHADGGHHYDERRPRDSDSHRHHRRRSRSRSRSRRRSSPDRRRRSRSRDRSRSRERRHHHHHHHRHREDREREDRHRRD